MRPYALVYLYRARLRVNAGQELFAGLGVAIAVALLFGTLVASGSIASSSGRVVRAVTGPANLQLRSRDGDGFSEALLTKVRRLSGVRRAAPLLEQTATVATASGKRTMVDIAGSDLSLALLNGLARTLPLSALAPGGIGLSQTAGASLGITAASTPAMRAIKVSVRGASVALRVSSVLGPETFGALAHAHVAVMPIRQLQLIAGLPRRITRVLVETRPGMESKVRREMQALAANRLTVARADQDEALLRQTLAPSNQASALFAAISALLGFLIAFNAMLLTVPERRQVIAGLRVDGARRAAIVQMVVFQALCLGVTASILGVGAGYVLSTTLFEQSPGYLAQAFTLGTGTVVGVTPVAVAFAGGVLATLLASLLPLVDLRSGRSPNAVYQEDGVPGNLLGGGVQRGLLAVALVLLATASALFFLVRSAAIASCLLLALAAVLSVPTMLAAVLRLAEGQARRRERMTLLPVALSSLHATTLRSLALTATGTLALFGSVALGGARSDLLHGISRYTSHYVGAASVWVVTPRDNQATTDFNADDQLAKISQQAGVARASVFAGSFLDLGDRRVWVIAWPTSVGAGLLKDQIVDGSLLVAAKRLRQSGWVTISQQMASRSGAHIGGTFSIPTPTGLHAFKVAATTTNFGWSPGAVVMSAPDYARAWASTAPTAFGLELTPGTEPSTVVSSVRRALGSSSGLEVLTAQKRAASINSSASEGLGQLGDIAFMLLLAAILAMFAALGSSIWQRRVSLAALRLEGTKPAQLRRLLALEVLLMLMAGCVTGALAGVLGEVVVDSYLVHVTGFPVAVGVTGRRPLEIFLIVVCSVSLASMVPGWVASRVSPTLALEE